MPRKDAYAITLTTKVRQRIFDLLIAIEASACKQHSGPNLRDAVSDIRMILLHKSLHKYIK